MSCATFFNTNLNDMKLYKAINNQLHFWETWDISKKAGAIHIGKVGERGQYREVSSGFFSNFRNFIQKEIDQYCENGYEEIDIDDHLTLLIEFTVDGMGTDVDVEKRTRL